MQLTCLAAIGTIATTVAAINSKRGFTYPASVPDHEKRQTNDAKYECHSNCGNALQDFQAGDEVCSDKEWISLYQGCLECALEFDIWRYYGGGLTPAAQECGFSTTPVEAGNAVSSNVAGEQATTSAPAKVTSTITVASQPGETGPATPAAGEVTQIEQAHSKTQSWSTTPVITGTVHSNSTIAEPTSVPDAAAQFWLSNVAVVGAALVVAANLL